MTLPTRARKLIGTFLLLAFIIIYAFLIMLLGVRLLEDASQVFSIIYYVVTGCAWAFPAMLILKWMLRPDAPQS